MSQGATDDFRRQGMRVTLAAAYDRISETDFTEDPRALDVPSPWRTGMTVRSCRSTTRPARLELLRDGTRRTYAGARHGISGDFPRRMQQDILAFIA